MDLNKRYTAQSWPDHPETATLEGKNKFVGFWLLLAAETVTFASLFATYLALKDRGPEASEFTASGLFELPLVFAMTMILLTSSLTSVYAMHHMKNHNFKAMQAWLGITVLLGLTFLGLEIYTSRRGGTSPSRKTVIRPRRRCRATRSPPRCCSCWTR